MEGHVKVSGAWKKLEGLHVKVSGTWKEVQAGYVKVSGVWKQWYLFFTATADDPTPSGSDSDFAACGAVTSDICTVTASGGAAPYTYAWTLVSAPAENGPYTCNSPTNNATNWSDTVCDGDIPGSETWRCTVTDDDSNVVTVDVVVTLTWTNLS